MNTATAEATKSPLRPLAFAALAGTMAMMGFVAVVGPISRRLGMQEWHAGAAIAVAGVLWMLSARYWGALSDRIGRKPVLMTGLGACGVVYLILALYVDAALRAPPAVVLSVLALILCRGLIGAFYAAVPPTAAAFVADHVPPRDRASAMAQLGTANAVGLVFGPAAAGWLAGFGLQWALYAAGAMPLLALLVLSRTLPHTARVPSPPRPGPAKALWSDPRLRLPIVAAMVTVAVVAVVHVSIGFLVIDRLGFGPVEAARVAGYALTGVGCGLIVSQAVVMRQRQVAPRRWIAMGATLAAIGFGSVSLMYAQAPLIAAYAFAGLGMGMILPAFPALTANSVEPHEQGTAAGTVASAQGLGMVIGPLVGAVFYQWSPAAPYLFAASMLLLVAGMAILRK